MLNSEYLRRKLVISSSDYWKQNKLTLIFFTLTVINIVANCLIIKNRVSEVCDSFLCYRLFAGRSSYVSPTNGFFKPVIIYNF